jgi:hypothetical protein
MVYMAFEVLTKVATNTAVLDVTPYSLVQIYLGFGGASAVFCRTKMAAQSSVTSITFYII